MKDQLYYLVGVNVAIPLRNPFKVQKKFVETTNFIPDVTVNHSGENIMMDANAIISKGETWMPELDFLMENDSISLMKSPFSPSESFLRFMDEPGNGDKDKDEDWDEEEEDWDEDEDDDDDDDEDEDWDEDDEDWDEDDDFDEDDEDEDEEDWDEDSEDK